MRMSVLQVLDDVYDLKDLFEISDNVLCSNGTKVD